MTHRIYISRPIDDRDVSEIYDIVERAREEFRTPRFEVIDPTLIPNGAQRENPKSLVDTQLKLMKTCDTILIDMSLPNHTYIGCIAELVYAHRYKLYTVVYVDQIESAIGLGLGTTLIILIRHGGSGQVDSRKTPVIHEGEEDCPFCQLGNANGLISP